MAGELDALRAEVARNTDVDASATTLLTGLAAKIDELIAGSGDSIPASEVQALADSLRASTDGLVTAISTNTR